MKFEKREPNALEVIHPGQKRAWAYQLRAGEELHVVRALDRSVILENVFCLPGGRVMITMHNRSKKERALLGCVCVEVLLK